MLLIIRRVMNAMRMCRCVSCGHCWVENKTPVKCPKCKSSGMIVEG